MTKDDSESSLIRADESDVHEVAGEEIASDGRRADDQTNPDGSGAAGSSLKSTLIIAVVLAAVLVGGAYYWYQTYYLTDQKNLRAELNTVSAQLDAAQAELSDTLALQGPDAEMLDAVSGARTEIAQLKTKLSKSERSQVQLEQSVTKLYQQKTKTALDWVLAEAEYLVLAANQRLALEGDVNTAIAALKAADQRLRSADHPALIPLRDQLIDDVASLEAVKLPDIEGLAIYLAKIIEQVDELPTKAITESVKPFAETKQLEVEVKNWRKITSAVWGDLLELVEVKDAALPDSVLFDPELRYFLQQNLRLELASARLAVLRRDDQNFRASINLIENMLQEFYDTSATNVRSIQERLSEAKQYEFEPVLPKITGSLDRIRAQMAKRQNAGTSQ